MSAPDKLNEVKDEAQSMVQRIISWPSRTWTELSGKLENLHQANFEMGVNFADSGRLKDALFRFKMAVHFRPQFIDAWYNLGVTHMRMGEMRQAKIALNKALSLKGEYPEAAYMLATIDLASLPPEQRPTQMPAGMMEGFFAQAAPFYDQAEAQNNYQAGPVIFDAVKAHIAKPMDLQVMDVGCGTGLAALPFKTIAKDMKGIDLVPAMADVAKTRTMDDESKLYSDVYEADIRALPSGVGEGDSADLVLCINVAQFMGELTQALHYMAWMVKPGGLVAITFDPCGGESYGVMQKTARFAHSDPYVRNRGEAVKLEHVATQKVELYPGMNSLLTIFKKPEAA